MKKSKQILTMALILVLFTLVTGCQSKEPAANDQTTTQSIGSSSALTLPNALTNGTTTLAEFGRGTCIPCKEMKPILDKLALLYKNKLNVVIVSVDDYRDLTNHYEIMAIPTQIFFDSSGKEIFRHIGFCPENEIVNQLKTMGIE